MGSWMRFGFICTSKTPNEAGAVTVSFHPLPVNGSPSNKEVFAGESPAGNLTVKLTEEAANAYSVGASYSLELSPGH